MNLLGKRITGTDEQVDRADRRLFLRYGMAVTAGGIIAPARKHYIVPASYPVVRGQDILDQIRGTIGPVPGLGPKQAMWAMAGLSSTALLVAALQSGIILPGSRP